MDSLHWSEESDDCSLSGQSSISNNDRPSQASGLDETALILNQAEVANSDETDANTSSRNSNAESGYLTEVSEHEPPSPHNRPSTCLVRIDNSKNA